MVYKSSTNTGGGGGSGPTTNPVTPTQGGTGIVNNDASTLTISGNFTTTLTVTGNTAVTLPTSGTLATTANLTNAQLGNVGTVIDGGGSVITTGQKGYIKCPYAGTITAAYLVADISGAIVIDVWKVASGSIPTVANTIVASAPPTLSGAQQSTDSTLTGWGAGKTITAGDVFGFNVNSATTVTRVTLQLLITKS